MSLIVGRFQINSDLDAWSLERLFNRDMDRVADITLLDVGRSRTLALRGTTIAFTADAEVTHQIELLWPDQDTTIAALAPFDITVPDDHVGVRIRLAGAASASAAARVPSGALKIGLGASGGGHAVYERLDAYPVSQPITEVIDDVLGSLRLPSQVVSRETLPALREVLSTTLDGYLQLSADLSWGAILSNTRQIEAGQLALEFQSRLALAATAAAKYRIAGTFTIQCCRSGDRARFIVRKARESTFTFAADFKLDAEFETAGLPETADEFLGKLLGGDVDRVLRTLDRVQRFESIEQVKEAVGNWVGDGLSELAMPLIGKALDASTTREFLEALRDVSAQYTSLDERIARLYQDNLDDVPGLSRTLKVLAAVRDPDGLKQVSDARAFVVFRKLAGDRLYDALLDTSEFNTVIEVAGKARDFIQNGSEKLKKAIRALQERFALDPLMRRVQALSSPDALRTLADEQLRRLVAMLLERPFDAIEQAAKPAFKELQATLKALDQFNQRWYAQLLQAANAKFKATVAAEFARASSSQALLDVEIDVRTPLGRRLAGRAAVGDFAALLADAASPAVKLRDAVLTHVVARQTQLRVNVLGFEIKNVSRLISSSTDQFQQSDGGLVLLHAFETRSEVERVRRDERTLMRFMLRGAAEGLAPRADEVQQHLLETLREMSAAYEFEIEDSKTSAEELLEYLDLAESLGLIASPAAFLTDLRRELPAGWTKVKVQYAVRYEPEALAATFKRDTMELQRQARAALVSLVGRALIVPGRPNDARLGLAYQDEGIRSAYQRSFPAAPSGAIAVFLPAYVTRGRGRVEALPDVQKVLLGGVFTVERHYLEALGTLDQMMDRLKADPGTARTPITARQLDDIVEDFVGFADSFPSNKRINPFFGTFDALVLAVAPRARRAALVLEITPRKTAEPVTKFLTL